MLSAIAASTGGDGTSTRPSVARASVMLWASVNAVMVLISIQEPRTTIWRRLRPSIRAASICPVGIDSNPARKISVK